jgi:AraC-like DNA-binding protein
MLAQDYLALRLVRLKPADQWIKQSEGLCFVFVKGGVGRYLAKPANRLVSGDALVLNGGAGAKLGASDNGELVFWWFSLCLEHLFPLFATNEIHLLQPVLDAFKVPRLYSAASNLAVACHRLLAEVNPQFDLDHRSQLLRIASSILGPEFKQTHNQRSGFIRAEEHIIQVFESLSADELLTLSVGELAAKFSCSRRHLNRLFHHHFGFSVAALRMEMRLLKAVSLLRDPDAKVINVAERCGFNHLGLFNTCFKRRFGTSPGQWRKVGVRTELPSPMLPSGNLNCPLKVNGLCPLGGRPNDLPPPGVTGGETKPASARPFMNSLEMAGNGEPAAIVASSPQVQDASVTRTVQIST